MYVKLIAYTTVIDEELEAIGWVESSEAHNLSEADVLAECAGRLCYLSWDRPNPATASNEGYLANIGRQQHFSVLEHANFTFAVKGVSRSMLMELERHRHLSFSVVSQRYVDHGEGSDFRPVEPSLFDGELRELLSEHGEASKQGYEMAVALLLLRGYSRKEARGAARAFLPEATETRFIVTGNVRTWREIIQKRYSSAADAEIRLFAGWVLTYLREYAPNSVQDLSLEEPK